MSYEIGSHFEIDDSIELKGNQYTDWLPNLGDATYTFSGRSAIELAILDIKQFREIKSIYIRHIAVTLNASTLHKKQYKCGVL